MDLDGTEKSFMSHPLFIGGAILAVALLAYLTTRGGQGTTVVDATFAGGGAARAIDPNAAAIEESAITASGTEYGQLLSYLSGLHSTDASESVDLAQTAAGRDTSLANTSAALTSSLAQTEAQRQVSLSNIASSQEVQDARTAADVVENGATNAANLSQLQVTSATQLAIANANASNAAAEIASQADQAKATLQAQTNAGINANQTAKDLARAQDNTGIVNTLINGISSVVKWFAF